jgi:hypothetical protein
LPFPLQRAAPWLVCAAAFASPAFGGPPFLTDDPQPTDKGHWEIYNFAVGSHDAGDLEGEAGVDLNYGAADDLQLTAVLPIGYRNENGFSTRGLRGGTGVVELAVKYKFIHTDDKGWAPDVSVFPRVFVTTDSRFGSPRTNLLLPIWAGKDLGPWQVFGGGGYQINPGADQRNFWQGGVAVNRTLSTRLQLGAEVFSQTRDTEAGSGFTALNAAVTYKLVKHWSLLASAGPTWEQRGGHGQVFYLALKADY